MNQLKERALSLLNSTPTVSASLPMTGDPLVMLFIGINGSGKTTSIAKLGYHLKNQGHYPLLGAGDTFRAAAIEQLSYWAEQIDIPIVKTHPGGDVAAVAFDALNAAKSRKCDMVLLDTAGRLQNKIDLIQELNKVKKTCAKVIPSAPHEVFLVLDATMGQNALDQALVFHQHLSLTGLIITKLDGSAKGGVLLSIYHQLRVPIRWVGTGEGKDDLIPFDPKTYVNALFSN